MDLIKQIKNWNNQRKWRRIINAVERVKPAARNPEMNFILGHAYLRQAHEDLDDMLFRKAVKVLGPLEDTYYSKDFVWNFDIGTAFYYSNQYIRAHAFLKRALSINSQRDVMPAFLDLIPKSLLNNVLPHFNFNFQTRVAKAWEEFAKKESNFRQLLDKSGSKRSSDELLEEVSSILEIAFFEPLFDVWKEDQKYMLMLTGRDLYQVFLVEYFKRHAPESILKNWEIFNCYPRGYLAKQPDFPKIDPNNVWLSLVKSGGDIFSVSAFFDVPDQLKKDPPEKKVEDLKFFVLNAVGSVIAKKYFIFSLPSPKKEDKDISLPELSAFLKEKKIDVEADSYTQLNHEVKYRKYHNGLFAPFVPKDLRWDITSGSTKVMKILDRFPMGMAAQIADLQGSGAMAGFFFYRTENLVTTKEKSRSLKKFRQSFIKELLEKAGPDKVTILGDAMGKEQDYVDVLMYDTYTVIDIAAEFLRASPVSLSGFHVMQRFSGTVLFSGENVINAEGYKTDFGRIYGYQKDSDGKVMLPLIQEDEDEDELQDPIAHLLTAVNPRLT